MTLAAPLLAPPINALAVVLRVPGWASRWVVTGLAATVPVGAATTQALWGCGQGRQQRRRRHRRRTRRRVAAVEVVVAVTTAADGGSGASTGGAAASSVVSAAARCGGASAGVGATLPPRLGDARGGPQTLSDSHRTGRRGRARAECGGWAAVASVHAGRAWGGAFRAIRPPLCGRAGDGARWVGGGGGGGSGSGGSCRPGARRWARGEGTTVVGPRKWCRGLRASAASCREPSTAVAAAGAAVEMAAAAGEMAAAARGSGAGGTPSAPPSDAAAADAAVDAVFLAHITRRLRVQLERAHAARSALRAASAARGRSRGRRTSKSQSRSRGCRRRHQ